MSYALLGKANRATAESTRCGVRIGGVDDAAEREADRMADEVTRGGVIDSRWSFARIGIASGLQRKCSCGGSGDGDCKCDEHKEDKEVRRKAVSRSSGLALNERPSPIVRDVLRSAGHPLDNSTRHFFERRFNHDFGSVRFHFDSQASKSARSIGALAYTAGNHIVFQTNAYAPQTADGLRLVAHELSHVIQQSEVIRRMPDAAVLNEFNRRADQIKQLAEYKKLEAISKTEVEQILAEARKRDNALDLMKDLEELFATPEQPAVLQAAEQEAKIAAAAKKNAERLGKGDAQPDREEDISRAKSSGFRRATGQDGTFFQINDRDLTNIAVKIKLRLFPKKQTTGNVQAIKNIKSFQDAIEKRASTWGYSVDIDFVDQPGPDVFSVGVNTEAWPTSGNFAGSDEVLAHEIHHLLGLPDRYNYIEKHHKNPQMRIPDRIHWFLAEFHKTVANGPESIMAGKKSPLDDDVCMVAGKRTAAEIDACVQERRKARSKVIAPALDTALQNVRATRDIVADDAKLLTGLNRPHISEQLFQKNFPVGQARRSLDAVYGNLQTVAIDNVLAGTTLRPVSALAKGCDKGAIAPGTKLPLYLCPQFFEIGVSEQSRAVLREMFHIAGIGGPGDQECTNQDCTTSCGGAASADTWVKYTECMAKT